jgi:hypothetical protein
MSTQEELKTLKKRHSTIFWANPAVCGIDIAEDSQGNPVFTVHLKSDEPNARRGLPAQIEGHPVNYLYNPIEKQQTS